VYGLNLGQADLVVLSACQTQLGELSAGDEVVGLNRAFLYGAPTVIASLWSVDDEATGALMGQFYTHLLAGMGKAEALQAAQNTVRTDPHHPEWAHPYYWAAFVLSGDAGPRSVEVELTPEVEPSPQEATPTPVPAAEKTSLYPFGAALVVVVVLLVGLFALIRVRKSSREKMTR
jgi:hypothetical protein